jgi:hypothetical protein
MKIKRILIASAAFFPENSPRSFRATELAIEFAKHGHEVTVLTLNRGEATRDFCRGNNIRLKYLPSLRLKPIQISTGRFNLLWRALNRALLLLLEFPDVELMFKYKKALRSETGYDLLLSFSVPYPVQWGCAWAQGKNKKVAKHWVADCGDPYMGDLSDSFRKLFYFSYLEKFMFRTVDIVTIPVEAARIAYYPEFHDKIRVIPQGINFEDFTTGLPVYIPNKILTFGYAGSFILGKRDPSKFLEYVLQKGNDFRFIIFTSMASMVSSFANRSNGRVIVKPYVPRKELIHELAKMDFIVNFENSTMTQAPSKLIDYNLAGRPVLSIPSNDLPTRVIDEFFDRNNQNQLQMIGYDQYRIETIAQRFLQLVNDGQK